MVKAPRVSDAPQGGSARGWLAPFNPKPYQRVAVRGNRAWVRCGARWAEFHRVDIVSPGYMEGLDGWGSVKSYGKESVSHWVDPSGRHWPRLRQAVESWVN